MQNKIKGLLNRVQENAGGNNVSAGQDGIGSGSGEVVFTSTPPPEKNVIMARP